MPRKATRGGVTARLMASEGMGTAKSRYRAFCTLEEAEGVVEWARLHGYPTARVANGFDRSPRKECLWLYTRPDSRPDGKTITVYAYTKRGLLYYRENGEFQ